MSPIEQAFADCYDGYSADRVVVDPELNQRFIQGCRQRELTESVATLNRDLLNLRKRGRLARYRVIHRTSFRNEDSYRFSAEIAARFMERRHGTSLDNVLCDPDLTAEFDRIAERIMPGFSTLQYRWAALNLRKGCRLRPELTSRVAPAAIEIHSWPIHELRLEQVPMSQGLYLLYDSTQYLYVGESDNLRSRLKKHLDHSDNKGFARWLWESGPEGLHVEIHVLASDTATRARKALELELIRIRRPVFNVQR
jgi:site-specific DNA-methyltransferase (adenine-specific)